MKIFGCFSVSDGFSCQLVKQNAHILDITFDSGNLGDHGSLPILRTTSQSINNKLKSNRQMGKTDKSKGCGPSVYRSKTCADGHSLMAGPSETVAVSPWKPGPD